jgi:hypothetical protein
MHAPWPNRHEPIDALLNPCGLTVGREGSPEEPPLDRLVSLGTGHELTRDHRGVEGTAGIADGRVSRVAPKGYVADRSPEKTEAAPMNAGIGAAFSPVGVHRALASREDSIRKETSLQVFWLS